MSSYLLLDVMAGNRLFILLRFGTGTSGLPPVLVHKGCVDRVVIRTRGEIKVMLWPNGLTLLLLSQQQESYWFQSKWDTLIHFHSWVLHAGRWEGLLVVMLSAVCWYTGACSCENQSFFWHSSFMYPCFVCECNVCQALIWQSWRQKFSVHWVSVLVVLIYKLHCDACLCIRRQVWDTGECSPSLLILSGCSHTVEFGILIT